MYRTVFVFVTLIVGALNQDDDYDEGVIVREEVEAGCELPEEWSGTWYLHGLLDNLLVTRDEMGVKGLCYRDVEGDKYILYDRLEKCYKCLVIFDRHPNILQFKESGCEPLEDGADDVADDLCERIPSDTPLHTLVRVSSGEKIDIECPFYGSYQLAYRQGGTDCSQPGSRVEKCMESSQVALKIQACVDHPTESGGTFLYQIVTYANEEPAETLTCRGNWTDGNVEYMIGLVDKQYHLALSERIRCFVYHRTRRGFRVAQSGDATCIGMRSIEDGERLMTLKEDAGAPSETCSFPEWATAVGTFYNFVFTSVYEFSEDGTSLFVSNYSLTKDVAHQISLTECHSVREELEGEEIKLVTKVTAGCETIFKCMKLYRRTDDIIEIQEGRPARSAAEACLERFMDEERLQFTLLIRSDLEPQPCTADGLHNVTEINMQGKTDPCDSVRGFHEVDVRCTDDTTIIFRGRCDMKERVSEFLCLGGWEETVPYESLPSDSTNSHLDPYGGVRQSYGYNQWMPEESPEYPFDDEPLPENVTLGYMLARPRIRDSKSPRRVCFIYMYYNDTYAWTVDTGSCLRNIRPGRIGQYQFNSTKLVPCGAFSTLFNGTNALLVLLSIWLSRLLLSKYLS